MTSARLPEPPRAETPTVETLVREVLKGKIRIPEFQRSFRWDGEQVLKLLDSVFRGFPVGALLMWKHHRPAETFRAGPVTVVAPERHDAWAVVDGQQRLTTLVGTLARPEAAPDPDDKFAIWLDPEAIPGPEMFRPATRGQALPTTWVPVPVLLDSAALLDWLIDRPFFQENKALRQAVIDVGKRLREYVLPLSVVEAEDETVPREIYARVNRQGTQMEEADVFNAITGDTSRRPARLEDLQEEARSIGLGQIPRHKLLQCVMAVRGLDVTRRLTDQPGRKVSPGELIDALAETGPALLSALAFLRGDAQIPHLRLLPYPVPLIVLTRFYRYFRDPRPRSRLLLVRWVWRGMLTGVHEHGERRQLRGAISAIVPGQEEESVQRMLRLVPRVAPPNRWWLDVRFDGRSAASRIAGLALASLRPRHLETGEPLDVTALLETHGAEAFRPLDASGEGIPGNRLLHPAAGIRPLVAGRAADPTPESRAVLSSHAIEGEAVDEVVRGSWPGVIAARREHIGRIADGLGAVHAGWGRSDRMSLDALLAADAEAPA